MEKTSSHYQENQEILESASELAVTILYIAWTDQHVVRIDLFLDMTPQYIWRPSINSRNNP